MEKRYYWLKMPNNFFEDKQIKKLRRIAGGDTFTIIYLKMLLKSMRFNGNMYFEGVEDTIAEEIALDIDEDPDNVLATLSFLERAKLIEVSSDGIFLSELPNMIGSESASAERMRNLRKREKASQCDTDVTNTLRLSDVEKDIDIVIDKDIDIYNIYNKNTLGDKNQSPGDIDLFFDELWSRYPKKKGKGAVSKTKKKVLYRIGIDELSRAIERYTTEFSSTGKDNQYMMYGSTFFNSGYVDYLDAEWEKNNTNTNPVKQSNFSYSDGYQGYNRVVEPE